ncbi:MAG: RNA 2',3'-cyclic phosphodiesterase [Candidatus Hadarchaeales archaeon]
MRTFLALEINEEVRERLVKFQRKLLQGWASLKLVEPENLHLTLKFLGEVEEGRLGEIEEAVRKGCAGSSPFIMEVKGTGVFPNPHYVRVVWAGVGEGWEKVSSLQRNVDRELGRLGFPRETEFVPHLTLARVKSVRDRERFLKVVEEGRGEEFGKTEVREVHLKKSLLTPKGPIYEDLRVLPLK